MPDTPASTMNELTQEILVRLLRDPKSWDKKTGKPVLPTVRHNYLNVREYLWVQKIYFPRYFRATRLLKAMGWPDDHFVWLEEDFAEGWIIVCDECGDALQRQLEPYFADLWEAPGWEIASFTIDDLLALEVSPAPEPSRKTRELISNGQLQFL